ncbi:MAG TPA: DNA photolyase [Syntrophobacteria bacterium]|nr:DNA photolyase [Syntrophobacteria bacterium]
MSHILTMTYLPKRLVIEAAVAETALVRRILACYGDVPIAWVEKVAEDESALSDGQTLEVVGFPGRFVKSCPGTRSHLCCGYQILHLGTQCSLGCTYCILQAYLSGRNLRLFANLGDMWLELREHLGSSPRRVHRLGTGEFMDSLLLDPVTHLSRELIPFFAGQPRAVLELKTKTANVELLEGLSHGGRTIVAWSLNPQDLIRSEEPGAADLEARLAAARRCQEWGYRLAFHFDPLIAYPNWRQGYAAVVNRLGAMVDPGRIAWISLGTLRFMPALKEIIRRRHGGSALLHEEFVPGLDGKLRYFRDLRVEMYRHLSTLLRRLSRDLLIYLCMESEDVWREALGFSPVERGGLSAMLDGSV